MGKTFGREEICLNRGNMRPKADSAKREICGVPKGPRTGVFSLPMREFFIPDEIKR